ncbi:BadF/BadG/BcrA/BcrD ATPase family protein [Teredinibacter sp. KSP-S5-2]|uniref:BadF/BadG/BcrA/BcrD ATPase family protein n=1 Tax=Teredinibacter sp. KSP-S5-2 TaxID=3034506 RepID=UPI0029350115|nr:BadF/BadG/BcrA/BcrD ATPase family protein [Teredinibacter sp. KSP-S5-2]WNO08425.1 BadF/BadG/BcrA/BcrD ATPase family protein [Teredinibacter sp. KSP-S5-2]
MEKTLTLGIDIGSTTVKAVVVEAESKKILWSQYQRHETRQAEKVLAMLQQILLDLPNISLHRTRVFVTGSGAAPIAPHLNAKFIQEVNAVTMAVEDLHPDVGSVIELGGQDAKIIMFKTSEKSGEKRATTSMNDKCASGTGATIDKCFVKVGMPQDDVSKLIFNPEKLHHVAAKCGVFAETDIVNLVKSGIPSEEILCSLADAIVQQNLSVLTRGNTLKSKVLLLGGPNTYLPFLRECWRYRIPQTWDERGYEYPTHIPLDELIFAPENAEYYAAYGAVLFGLHEKDVPYCGGLDALQEFITNGRKAKLGNSAGPALAKTAEDANAFSEKYQLPKFEAKNVGAQSTIEGYIGLDGGSTSSKCVLVDEYGEILQKVYQLSKGNPLEDMKQMFAQLRDWANEQNATLNILGFGVTGYAGDVMETALKADANIVETVAHMKSAQHYFPNVDVICDVGGQDIKVLFMQNQTIKNFRLSNSCSAGNGMLLQAMADQFGVPVTEYAATAFKADLSPKFSYGCAVFLDSDRVNFQKEGFNGEELLAGLALVLPKNIWQYVVQIPRMAELGRIFVLQGGTQKNMAAVKAQVDYIEERVPNAEVYVHPHTGEAGALGAAFEAIRVVKRKGKSQFIGLNEAIDLEYRTKNDESTRCDFCANNCSRTFIDAKVSATETARYISGFSCEKGTVEDHDALRALNKKRRELSVAYPNLVDYEATWNFKHLYKVESLPDEGTPIKDIAVKRTLFGGVKHKTVARGFERSSPDALEQRKSIRIGIPKALNLWSTGQFWRAYFETLGILPRNIVFSDDTSEELWQAGGKYGSVDPCYPAKVVQAHIHNLLFTHHEKKPLNFIFFPAITHIPTFVERVMDTACCPIVSGTPKVVGAAFTKERDFFADRSIRYLDPAVSLMERLLLKQRMFECFAEHLHITEDENNFAIDQAFSALDRFDHMMQEKGKIVLDQIEKENRMALLMIGRPYHNDPGMNHGVLEEYQAMGYPILSMRSIPKDTSYLEKYFADDVSKNHIESPLEIGDVWPENYSVNSVQKVWATKFAARHPNVAVLDLSSFKCGHDAPTYGLVDRIVAASETPYSALHDIDANKPSGSIKIRVKTYGYTLKLAEEKLEDEHKKQMELKKSVIDKRLSLLAAAPEEIKLDTAYLTELKKWQQAKKDLETQNQHLDVVPLNVQQFIPAVEIDSE